MNETAPARRALIIANDTYDHASLSQLRAPEADARALASVLGDPEIGGFEVSIVHNAASHEVQSHIEDLFAESRPDDLLLLHFSGHGLKSDSGELFVAARNTRPDRLGSTAVPADFIQRCMRSARARTIVLFLDCCYGGAFGEGVAVRAAGAVNVMESFPAGRLGGGRGRAVISASSAMEYAFEGTTLTSDHDVQPSVFTSAVVQGLQTGEADRDEDGLVSLGELYDYVFDRVREQNPRQTPGRDVEMSGEVYLAKSRHKKVRPLPIPEAIVAALREPDPTYRRGAVVELRDRLGHPDLGVALGALEALEAIARSDTKSVADDAAAVIAAAAPAGQPDGARLRRDRGRRRHRRRAGAAAERRPARAGGPRRRRPSAQRRRRGARRDCHLLADRPAVCRQPHLDEPDRIRRRAGHGLRGPPERFPGVPTARGRARGARSARTPRRTRGPAVPLSSAGACSRSRRHLRPPSPRTRPPPSPRPSP